MNISVDIRQNLFCTYSGGFKVNFIIKNRTGYTVVAYFTLCYNEKFSARSKEVAVAREAMKVQRERAACQRCKSINLAKKLKNKEITQTRYLNVVFKIMVDYY